MPKSLRILVTAGPTREYIDSVRFLSNDSSGKMGFAIAAAAAARGHRVTLVHGPVALAAPAEVRAVGVVSAADMLRACRAAWARQDVLVMAAAVADYTPARRQRHKLKKSPSALMLALAPTVDILKTLSRARRPAQRVIGFALEDRAARPNAEKKLLTKRLDAIVLNRPTAIGAERSSVEILRPGGRWRRIAAQHKQRLAEAIVDLAEELCAEPQQLRG